MSYAIVTKEDEKSYKIRDFLIDKIKDEYDETKPTKVITVGGDGTFLKAVHMFEKNIDNIVFFIYNTGHLGYFSNYDDDSLNALIEQVNSNEYKVSQYSMLDYKINTSDGIIEEHSTR